jgi:hypothetical protein
MISRDKNIEYEVVRLTGRNSCNHPECNGRRQYGIKTNVYDSISFLGFCVGMRSPKTTKFHCPDHRPEHELASKAREKEHERARRNYQQILYKNQREEYGKIVSSEFLPNFTYNSRRLVMQNNSKFEVSDLSFEEAVKLIKSFRTNDPILVSRSDKYLYYIIKPDGSVEKREASYESDIDYKEFKEKYGDYDYRNRDYNPIRTRDFTSVNFKKKSIKDITKPFVNFEIIEWREYDKVQGNLRLKSIECPACGRRIRSHRYFLSRVIDEGDEKICVSDERCGKIMGVLNPKLINKNKYNIGLVEKRS